jgi:hypothetical protein
MTVNSLSPAFVKINYTSAYGAHVMTLPSVPLETGVYAPTGYAFDLRGAALPVEVSDAVIEFIDVIKPYFPSTTTFVDAIVYSQPLPGDVPTPVASFAIGIVGTGASPGWDKATQLTMTFRADDFTLFKLVFLDFQSGGSFAKTTNPAANPGLETLVDYVTADVTWLASRGGGRPATFLQESRTLNEKLRRSYNLT